ncbi:GTP-binding protein [Romboutsia ilealis]|uniref:GTP-binding protein n=1 Tax=Romboutsia ilealis TaxID=1115758 RepID=UPI00272D8791|nr:GTP-binding protein [Romboutsia ilealis]
MSKNKIINIAVIAHVDAGKSTLVDAFLHQSGTFRDNEVVKDCVMDSNDLEAERGITIYSKNCSINYKDYKINIVDTPGHSDFSSEVERVIKTVDTVILLVDASEGPMPQTRFVLQKSLEAGLRPILFINKIDKQDQRAEEVVDEVFDLFVDLNATDEQCEFPIIYGIAKQGIAKKEMDDESENLAPLFETVVEHVEAYPDYSEEPLQLQISALAYDDYVGRLGIGRVYKGTVKNGETVSICKADGSVARGRISKLTVYEGLKQVEKSEAYAGDIVVVAGMADISIGETICNTDNPLPMEMIHIEEPTLSMNFLVNDSPFAGKSGKFVTTRHLKDRLDKELEVNVGLKVEPMDTTDGYRVSGRGELHLSILLSTCGRSEVYFMLYEEADMNRVLRLLADCLAFDISSYVRKKTDDCALQHIFSVASGLDSMILGEDQILGQVRDAWEFSRVMGCSGKQIEKIFREAITLAKKLKTEWKISEHPRSLSYIGMQLLHKTCGIENKRVLVLGSGKLLCRRSM